jgi:hypothetical protein
MMKITKEKKKSERICCRVPRLPTIGPKQQTDHQRHGRFTISLTIDTVIGHIWQLRISFDTSELELQEYPKELLAPSSTGKMELVVKTANVEEEF